MSKGVRDCVEAYNAGMESGSDPETERRHWSCKSVWLHGLVIAVRWVKLGKDQPQRQVEMLKQLSKELDRCT